MIGRLLSRALREGREAHHVGEKDRDLSALSFHGPPNAETSQRNMSDERGGDAQHVLDTLLHLHDHKRLGLQGWFPWTSWFGCGALASNSMRRVFRENEIDDTVLPSLTAEDLKELGVAASGTAVNCSTPLPSLRADTNAT